MFKKKYYRGSMTVYNHLKIPRIKLGEMENYEKTRYQTHNVKI